MGALGFELRTARLQGAWLRGTAWLRRADGFDARRARAWCRILLGVSALALLGLWGLSRGGLDPTGKPLGTDFTSFWSAGRLALEGRAPSAYAPPVHHAMEVTITGRDTGYAAYLYPPVFLLVCLPFGALPYLPALIAWLVATCAAYARMTRVWLGGRFGWAPAFAFPGVLCNIGNGQNGLLTAALAGFGAAWLDRRPILAGVCLGALAFKPHLALAVPICLLVSGRWRTIAAASATAAMLGAAALVAFGPDAWRAFFAATRLARASLEAGLVGEAKMQSAFAAVRLFGGGLAPAYAAQALVAAAAIAGILRLNHRRARSPAEGPAMVAACLMMSPFLLDYDLALLAVPMAWLFAEGVRTGFRDWEKAGLGAAYIVPAVSRPLATATGLPLGPVVVAALFALVLRRGLEPDLPGTGAANGPAELSPGVRRLCGRPVAR